MSLSIPDFWKLVIESRLLTPQQCQLLGEEFGRVKGAATQGNVRVLSQWLISRNALTQYQATILEAGRSGPFHYGDYKVYDRIEQGAMSGMFRAIHEPTSHPVLLQFVTGEATQDRGKWAELVDKINAQIAVAHPHTSRVYEAVDLSSFKFIATDDIQGQPLDQRIGEGKALRPVDACRLVRQTALGLGAIHQAELVHGDIRIQNLWIDSAGCIKLARDALFEPAPLYLAQTDATSNLHVRADYMAPELAQPEKLPDTLTDIYALGCTMYQLLTGKLPFPGGDVMQKLNRHATEAIQPLEAVGVPQQIAQLVAYMMAKNPSVRYQQAGVVADQLGQFVDPAQLNVQPPAPPASLESYTSWIRQKQATLKTQAPAAPAVAESFPAVADDDGGTAVAAIPTVQAEKPAATRVTSNTAPSGEAPAPATPVKPRKQTNLAASRYEGKKMSKQNWIMIGSSVGGVALFAIVLFIGMSMWGGGEAASDDDNEGENVENNGGDDSEPDDGSGGGSDGETTNNGDATTTTGHMNIMEVPDNPDVHESKKLLWSPPTNGPWINTSYIPAAVRILIAARPAELLASPNGEYILKALGPKFDSGRTAWERLSGFTFSEIEQVTVGFHDNPKPGQVLLPSYRLRLTKPVPEADLVLRWGSPKPSMVPDSEGKIYSLDNGWAFFIPPQEGEEGVSFLLMAPEPFVIETAKAGAAPPLLRREMKELVLATDRDRHFTVVCSPNSLFNDEGQKLFQAEFHKVLDPLKWLIGDKIQATSASIHFDSHFYLEVRLKSAADKETYKLAEELKMRLNSVPTLMEEYIGLINPPAYWTKLSRRFPMQIGFLHSHMRIGVEDKHAVMNAVLPPQAAPNMLAASELVISSTPGATATVVTTTKPEINSYAELLTQEYDLEIGSDDMVNVVSLINEDVPTTFSNLGIKFNLRILGKDLELDGITKNQRVSISIKGKTFAEVLTGIVMSAQGSTDPTLVDKQKLIWVIGPDPDTSEETILLTTRRQAAEKKYTIPGVFIGESS